MSKTVQVRFKKQFVREPQNAPFVDAIMLGKTYRAHPTNREMCNYDYRVEVDGTFVVKTDVGMFAYRGIVPAITEEVELV